TDWEERFRGESGQVRIVVQEPGDTLPLPDSVPSGVEIVYAPVEAVDSMGAIAGSSRAARSGPPSSAGIRPILARARDALRPVSDLNLVTLVPASELNEGRIGSYRIGSWPQESGAYVPPRGFVRVTPENMNTRVSKHVRLADLLTKGQEDVWPKYVVVSPRALDKVGLTLQELEGR